MSSRVYITNKLPEHYDAISKSNANWNEWVAKPDVGQGSYTSHMVDTNKYGDPRSVLDAVTSPTARPCKIGMYAGVSRALLPQTISGTIKAVLAVAQTTDSKVYTKINVFIIDSTTGLNNGVRYATILNYEDSPVLKGKEWPHVPNSLSPVPAPIVLNFNESIDPITPVVIPANGREYRLVVEIGAISYAESGDVGLQHRFGVLFDDLTGRDDRPAPESSTYLEWNELGTQQIQFDNYKYLPPNHEVDLATTIPLGVTQIVNEPYRYYYRWYKYTPIVDTVLSIQACSGTNVTGGSSFRLYMQSNKGQPYNQPCKDWGEAGENVVFNHAVQAGRSLLIKTRPVGEFTFNWSLNIVQTPAVVVKKGDLFIASGEFNDNFYDPTIKGLYPVIWHSPTLGDIRTLSGKYPATKVGACLSNGKWALTQPITGEMFLFRRAPFLNMLERIQTDLTGGISTIGTDGRDFWLLGKQPNYNGGENRTVIRIDRGINTDPDRWTLPITTGGGALYGGACMGVSRDSKVLYYNDYILDGLVQRHDLELNVPMSPFAGTPGAGFYPEDIIVLYDNTICCLFRNVGNTITWVYHFDVNGNILHTFQGTLGPIHHIAHSSDDLPDRIWLWYHYNYPTASDPITNAFILRNVNGSNISGFGQTYGYINGRGPHPSAGPPALPVCTQPRWGSAYRGTLVPMMVPPEISGIYFLNGIKKHDTYYNNVENRIPDPTIRTALLGE